MRRSGALPALHCYCSVRQALGILIDANSGVDV